MRTFFWIGFGLSLTIISTLLFLQTGWVKSRAHTEIIRALESAGIQAEIGDVQGSIPYTWHLHHLQLKTPSGWEVSIERLDIRLSLLYLLKKELHFSFLQGENVRWTAPTLPVDATSALPFVLPNSFPYALSVKTFHLTQVASHLQEEPLLDLKGRLRITHQGAVGLLIEAKKNGRLLLSSKPKSGTKVHLTLHRKEGDLQLTARGPRQLMQRTGWTGSIQAHLPLPHLSLPQPIPRWVEGMWHISSLFQMENNQIDLTHFKAWQQLFSLEGSLSLNPEGLQKIQLRIASEQLSWASLQGRIHAELHFLSQEEEVAADIRFEIPRLQLPGTAIEKLHGSLSLQGPRNSWNGSTHLSAEWLGKVWTGSGQFTKEEDSLVWPEINIQSLGTEISSQLTFFFDGTLEGESSAFIESLHTLWDQDLYGSLTAKASWHRSKEEIAGQMLSLDLHGTEIHYGPLHSEAIHLHADVHSTAKEAFIECEKIRYRELDLSLISLETHTQGMEWPFHLFVEGNWGKPLDLTLDGTWNLQEGVFQSSWTHGAGSFFEHPYQLSTPTTLTLSKDTVLIPSLTIQLDNSVLDFRLEHHPQETTFHCEVVQLPLDFLSLNPLDVSVQGFFSGRTDWREKNGQTQGSFSLTFNDLEVLSLAETPALFGRGTLEGTLSDDKLQSHARFFLHDTPLLSLDSSLPIEIHLWPPHGTLLPTRQANINLSYNGQLEELFDFFNLGVHAIRGELTSRLTLTGTLAHPELTGDLLWNQGFYENYLTGTTLTEIQAHLRAVGDHIELLSFSAKDREGEGHLSTQGTLQLNLDEGYPFLAKMELNAFRLAQIEWAHTQANGLLQIDGTLQGANLRGDLSLVESRLTIPNHIPKPLPHLQVTYRGAYKPPPPPFTPSSPTYPLSLHVDVHAPSKIYVSGRGLLSEWGGDLHLGGTESAPTVEGKLELLEGGFSFSGRSFKLSEGSLLFTGKPGAFPILNLAATVETNSVVITARLKGALNAPQITFQSQPPLPMSAILSYLLFGQDLSEVNAFQALQIANSAASLSNDNTNVLESTRRSLGVDRLRVISSPSGGDEAQDSIALQVGKYITQGIIVSVSQGTEDSSTNLSIEIELNHGFILQLESQQEQEQGKFTLKWTLSY